MPKRHVIRFIALDISTNTGYALFEGSELIAYDTFTIKVNKYKADVKKFSDFPIEYPLNFITTAEAIAQQCFDIIQQNNIQHVVIEHPEAAKQRLSQRLLEWTHYALIVKLQAARIDFRYLLVHDWRNVVKCYIKHWPEYAKYNQKVRSAKQKAIPTKTGRKLAKLDGRVVSTINQKKLSILLANQKYGLEINDDNIADAINLGRAAIELAIFEGVS